MTDYHCLNSSDDAQTGYGAGSTGTTIIVADNKVLSQNSKALIHLDTSAIGTDSISAATIYWYNDSLSIKSPKAATWSHVITFYGGASIYANTTAAEPAGWRSHALTSGELASINKTGDTNFEFSVDGALAGQIRVWVLRAWDYVPNGTFSVYLSVTHASAGGPTKMTIIRA